jgi:hypothetical protein
MPLKPWYKVVTPREDLREGKPLDAAEFAVHLDDVRNNCAPPDYQKPDRFFARTYLTKNLSTLASEVIRRLSDHRVVNARDRVHQSMILFAAGRSEALKRFLVVDGTGNDTRFWTLAQALSALYRQHRREALGGWRAGKEEGVGILTKAGLRF